MDLDIIGAKEIELKEKEQLQPILRKNPSLIEDGLELIEFEFPTDVGPLDLLCVDREGTVVLVELKDEEDDKQLDQGLRYYDSILNKLEWISKAYPKIDSKKDPRLILIAPSFSENLKNIAKFVTLSENGLLELKEYHAYNVEGKILLVFNPIDVEYPVWSEEKQILSLEDKINYINAPEVRELFTNCLKQLKEAGIFIKQISGLWMSAYFKNKQFMYISPKRTFFVTDGLGLGEKRLGRKRINNKEEWNELFNEHIIPLCKEIENM